MNARSYLAVLLVAAPLLYFILHMHHNLESEIIESADQLRFYFADTYQISESELLFKYDPNDKPYDEQIAKWHKQCLSHPGSKLSLLQSQDGNIVGGFNTDTCWEGRIPQSSLTPFTFSLNTTERLLYFANQQAKMKKRQKAGFLFGKSVVIRPRADANGIEGCFHKENNEMGRMMTWLGAGPGKCFPIKKVEQFRVEIGEMWNLQNHFEEFLEEGDYGDAGQ